VISRIAAAVPLPVSADIEAGYGDSPDAVAATVAAVTQAGAVGVNLEDRRDGSGLFEPSEQADRLAAARAASPSSALTTAGVVRISLGSAVAQAAYGVATRAATELFTAGTYDSSADGFDYGTMNDALTLQ
jgi:2-methylisocitrate lyase-like PEP mutase family enzyme